MRGLNAAYGDAADLDAYPEPDFDIVYDNNAKDLATCKELIDACKVRGAAAAAGQGGRDCTRRLLYLIIIARAAARCAATCLREAPAAVLPIDAECSFARPQRLGLKHYVYVSSAGAYKANSVEPMHIEHDERKATAGHVEVEKYLERSGLPYTIFHPLYIYGPHTAKDCEQWFVDRIIRCVHTADGLAAGAALGTASRPATYASAQPPRLLPDRCLPLPPPPCRDRPVPIPAPGEQLVSLTHVEDVASMMAAVPGNKYAIGEHYNMCSDRCISLKASPAALQPRLRNCWAVAAV